MPRIFKINLTIEPGFMIDYQNWSTNLAQFDIPWNQLELAVRIDNDIVYQGLIVNTVTIDHQMNDSTELEHHVIDISVSGFSPGWKFLDQGREVVAELNISQFKIEKLNCIRLIAKEGTKIFIDPDEFNPGSHELLFGNHSQIINFNTPIYPWLLSKYKDIVHE